VVACVPVVVSKEGAIDWNAIAESLGTSGLVRRWKRKDFDS